MDLSRLLCSNEPPNPSDIPAIQASLARLLVKQLKLELELEEIEENVEQHFSVLSPIRRVPVEILSDIFSLAVLGVYPGEPSSYKTMFPSVRKVVERLGLVCWHWRRATLITRAFWSEVSVDSPLEGPLSRRVSFDKVGTWLSHQDALPRVLEVGSRWFTKSNCANHDSECRYRSPSFGRLLAEGPALDKLTLRLKSPECLQNLFDSFPLPTGGWERTFDTCPWSSFRQLSSLALHFACWVSDCGSLASHSSFAHLPPITNFELYLPRMEDSFDTTSGGEDECDKAELNIPRRILEGLKQFTYACDWDLRHASGPLAHCINLEILILDLDGRNSQEHPLETNGPLVNRLSTSGIKLPHLLTLQVKKCTRIHSIEHLKFFRAPALETLDIALDHDGTSLVQLDQVELWWNPLVNRIDCLRTLCLRNMEFDTGVLIAMKIQELPALTHLTLDSVYPQDELFGEAGPFQGTLTLGGGRSFPSLQVLELLQLESYFDLELVFDFVENRRGCTIDGKATMASDGRSDCIRSIVAMYYKLDSEFAERSEVYYERAQLLTDAGVRVEIGESSQEYQA